MSMSNRFFKVVSFRVVVEEEFLNKAKRRWSVSEASIKVRIKHRGKWQEVYESADGNGPVNALDNALRKALGKFFPQLCDVHLVDYGVCRKNGDMGTESSVEVTITSTDETRTWETKGVSKDIIRASLVALAKSFARELSKY